MDNIQVIEVSEFKIQEDNITCRACLTQNAEMQNLFTNLDIDGTDLLNMFISCTSLDVTLEDPYPKYICNSCLDKLDEAYSFWKTCRQSIDELKLKLSLNKEQTPIKRTSKRIQTKSKSNKDVNFVVANEAILNYKYPSKVITCDKCEESFTSKGDFAKHKKSVHDVEKLQHKCTKCLIAFDTEKDYFIHYHKVHVNPVSDCDVVGNDVEIALESDSDSKVGDIIIEDKINDFVDFDESILVEDVEVESVSNKSSKQSRCCKCQIIFNSVKEYNTHYYQVHTKPNIKLCNTIEITDVDEIIEVNYKLDDNEDNKEAALCLITNDGTVIGIDNSKALKEESAKPKCLKCDLTFAHRSAYVKHMRHKHNIHPVRQIKCKKCEIVFATKKERDLHNYTQHEVKCLKCNILFSNKKDYDIHHKREHRKQEPKVNAKKSYKKCRKCGLKFANRTEFMRHYRKHYRYLCPVCGYSTHSTFALKEHSITHTDARPYVCNVCGKTYRNVASLNVHKSKHTGELKYDCQHCDKKFLTWSARSDHMKNNHSTFDYVCDVCNKAFPTATKRRLHMRRHTGEKPFGCTECDMAFVSKGELKMHEQKHTGVKNYSCEVCDKRFARSNHLKQHLITHTGERRHKCDYCKKAFSQAHVLKEHMNTHKIMQDDDIVDGVEIMIQEEVTIQEEYTDNVVE